jgi:mannose/fructose/N-acetylgalactosamine-specific phosphotransferase system component IIB
MSEQIIEIEADSLGSAREQAKAKIPAGFYQLSEKIISDGKQQSVMGIADSLEAAYEKARNSVPKDAVIITEKERDPGTQKILEVEAVDEEDAKRKIKDIIKDNGKIESLKLKSEGKKGVIGVGKKLNLYDVTYFRYPVALVIYKQRVKIQVEVGEKKPEGIKIVTSHKEQGSVRTRSGCLTAYLILMLIANLIAGFFYFIANTELRHRLPSKYEWLIPLMGFLCFANIVFAIALLNWKKWGLFGAIVCSIIVFIINLTLGISIINLLFGLVGLGILLYLVSRDWDDFK